MCWCAVLLESKAIGTRNMLNVRQKHLLQDDVSVIFSIEIDARLQEVDISAPKTRHPTETINDLLYVGRVRSKRAAGKGQCEYNVLHGVSKK